MEIILKTNNETSIAKIIALAKKLDVSIVQRGMDDMDSIKKEELKNLICNFKADAPSSFGDAAAWQTNVRKDRELPCSD